MTTPGAKRRILVGVGGGIAAYKVCSVIRHFTEAGHEAVSYTHLTLPTILLV